MKKRRTIPAILAVLLFPGGAMVGVLIVRSGPTASVPTEDPILRLNRDHADLKENAAELYAAALAVLAGQSKEEWAGEGGWHRGREVPDEAIAWVAENARAIDIAREAVRLPHCWFQLTRDSQGQWRAPELTPLRTLAKLFLWRARLAAERRDLETFADSVVTADRIARHVPGEATVIHALVQIGCLALAQDAILEPYAWAELSATDRNAYAQRIASCFEPPAPLTSAFTVEQDLSAWTYVTAAPTGSGLKMLAPDARVSGEMERCFRPQRELAALPVEQQTDPDNPVRRRALALTDEKVSRLNFPRHLAQILSPSLVRSTDVRSRLVATQRGNRTVIELFNIRDRTSQFPATLDDLPGQFKIDPYTGRPFIYRLTGDGFALCSAGLDRDDDGGVHHRKFGEQRATSTQPAPPPDGDYVFWPLATPAPER